MAVHVAGWVCGDSMGSVMLVSHDGAITAVGKHAQEPERNAMGQLTESVLSVDASGCGQLFLTGHIGGVLRWWHPTTDNRLEVTHSGLHAHAKAVSCGLIVSDECSVSCSWDGSVWAWESATGVRNVEAQAFANMGA